MDEVTVPDRLTLHDAARLDGLLSMADTVDELVASNATVHLETMDDLVIREEG